MADEWITPDTSSDDSEGRSEWRNLANSHDGNWANYAYCVAFGDPQTSEDAIATWEFDTPVLVDKLKVKAAGWSLDDIAAVTWTLSAKWDDEWHTVTTGSGASFNWSATVEFDIDSGTPHVLQAIRFQFENHGASFPGPTQQDATSYFYELAGWEVAAGIARPKIGGSLARHTPLVAGGLVR